MDGAATLTIVPSMRSMTSATRTIARTAQRSRWRAGGGAATVSDTARWREQLIALLTRAREAMDRHPGIARVPLANVPTGPNGARVAERMLGLMRAGGIDDRVSAWASDVIFLYVNAASYEASIYLEEGTSSDDAGEEIHGQFSALPADEFPTIVSMLGHLTSGSADQRFAFGLQLMIEGLLHVKPPAPQGAAAG